MSVEQTVLDRLAAVAGRPVVAVEVKGETFHVRAMDSHQRTVYTGAAIAAQREGGLIPDYMVAAIGLCNPDGTPVFPQPAEGFAKLRDFDGEAMATLAQRIYELSGMTKKASEDSKGN